MRITLNLATRPFADLGPAIKRLRIAIAVLVLIAICLTLALRAFHQKAEEARIRGRSLDSQIALITAERQGYQNLMRQPENAQLLLRVADLNKLFDEKSFSWTLAMEDLEIVLPAGVQVSTLEPIRATDGSITLHLRVIGPRDRAIDLVRNLEGSKDFLQPRIVGENSESSGSPGEKLEPVSASNRVNFDLLVNYNPVSPTESGTTKKKLNQRSEKSEAAAAERQKGNPGSKLKSQPNSQVEKKLAPAASLVAPSAPAASPTSAPVQPVRPRFTGQAPPFTSAPYPAQNQRVPAPQTTPVAHPNTGGPQ